ncbi:SusC/RagA family TonB-linked outer membrane protein [Sediminibacterium goheungense]|uniref:TonB-linked SusC/RagA family outer membrane protein n=1 Tax=Sediminibacterium goheungense TaxID=1086393 RepID=A0A4R6J127_9BACT|nr:SusC/RagA family TonB-linked outer membrane protein [Sediminibacterium goheungense]TDO28451.1 TonB-linked SusC/RagA family outer membrane protein [Sediminibacterium goheungense]
MRKLVSLLTVLMLFTASAFAQNKTVTGKVTESNGTPISGATISANGKPVGATTTSGDFSVTLPTATTSITISSLGFNDRTVTLTGSALSITLTSADAGSVSEVVVTGYTSIQRKKFSGAIANVSAQEVKKQPFGSFDQALQGQAAGVSVVANSGQPGANAIVRIRGNGSISGGNVPLYIMDGIEISAADFSSLNQGDFERVELLKDAVATAMYGSRGANGVIVISTRRGRAGTLQLNYDAQVGWSTLPQDRLVMMNSDQKITYELQRGNPYGWTTAEADSLRKVNFSWKDALFQTGMTHQHMISASGGSATSKFFASLSYMDQEGIVKTTGLKRYTARINVDNTIKNWRFGVNLQAGFSKLKQTAEGNTTISSPLNAIRWSNPYERDRDPRTGDFQQFGGPGYLTSGQPNGAMELFLDYNNSIQLKTVATSYLEFHFPFLKGLSARTNWGIDYTNNETTNFNDPRTAGAQARNGSLNRNSSWNFRYTGTTSLNYKQNFGKHEVEGGLFTEVVKNDSRNFGFTGYGFTNGFNNEAGLTAGSTANANYIPAIGGGGSRNGIYSYFGIFNYGYDSKYYVTLVGRRDGSSRFGVNNRFANFGSVGFTWSVSSEKFMENSKLFDNLSLRASIGTTGNNITQAGDFPIPIFGRSTYAGVSGWSPGSPGNLDYRWETNRTINFGLDFSILKRRLSGSIELYDRKTLDLFYALPIDPSISGFSSIPSNFGSLRNRGVELSLRGDVIKAKDFSFSIAANITYNQNRIIDLPTDSVVSGLTILKEGKALNTLYLVPYAGVNPANGNAQYQKKDKSTTMVYSPNDKVYQGTSDAPWFGGITTSLAYKGFDLSAQLNFFLNRVQYNNDKNNVVNPTYFYDNMWVELLKEWKNPGDITNIPRPTSGATALGPANPYQTQTTFFLEDGSFWRLRNVTLGYTVPAKLLSKAGLRSARIFVQGQNWWTGTKFQGFDPEATGTSLVGAQYPALVQTTIGLNIGF